MATPLGHSIVGYALARAAGVKSPAGLAAAIGVAALPDVDVFLSYLAKGDPFALHREMITHKPVFPLLVGAATGLAASLLRGGRPTRSGTLRPAALATMLVGSHIAMDPLPLPYDKMPLESGSLWQGVATHAWNSVIDLAFYGALVMLVQGRGKRSGRRATVSGG